MRKYDLFIEHVPGKQSGGVGLVYEASLTLDDDLGKIVKSGGLKPYLDFHWSQLGIKKQWEAIGKKPKVGSLKVLALKAKGSLTMYMQATVSVCDGYQKTLPSPEKGAVLLKDDGSGCWKIVSHVCGDYVQTHGIKPLTKEKCRMMIEAKGGFLSA